MNKGIIQTERAASAQRDLFDNQIRIEDQLIEQKSEPHHPGSARDEECGQILYENGKAVAVCTELRYSEHDHEDCARRILQPSGPTVRTLTDTLNQAVNRKH